MNLRKKADQIREETIRVALKHKQGHLAPSLSCVEILTILYYEIMGGWDQLVFSKAHGCYSLYCILYDKGLIDRDTWHNFQLPGCATTMPGVAFANGSLGHGLPVATGIAFGLKLQGQQSPNVFCVVGDGEMQEGSSWEAIQFAVHHGLNNLTIIVDDNSLQAMDWTTKVIGGSLTKKFLGFGVNPWECDGHNISELLTMLNTMVKLKSNVPNILIANTIKGKGLPCQENIAKHHFRLPACVS